MKRRAFGAAVAPAAAAADVASGGLWWHCHSCETPMTGGAYGDGARAWHSGIVAVVAAQDASVVEVTIAAAAAVASIAVDVA